MDGDAGSPMISAIRAARHRRPAAGFARVEPGTSEKGST
ncbi:unnamed protein product [[Actinomadura] parvosata subsp. kistnae]|nr:unnamed protein product [Actinomadura parvosata subsp. kistnae]